MPKRQPAFFEQLRQAIRDSELSPYAIARAAGLRPEQVYRFMSGKRGMELAGVAKLCEVLGLQLVKRK